MLCGLTTWVLALDLNKEHSWACPRGSLWKFGFCEERVPERDGLDLSLQSSQLCLPEHKLMLRREF